MGVTIHYSGSIREYNQITSLNEELTDIASIMGWKSNIIDDDHFRGTIIIAPGCEPMQLTFNTEGRLANIFLSNRVKKVDTLLFSLFTKTQFASPDIHIALIKILKHINGKYLSQLQVFDEGGYWETENKSLLKDRFRKNAAAIDRFCDLLSGMNHVEGESAENLADRIIHNLENEQGKMSGS